MTERLSNLPCNGPDQVVAASSHKCWKASGAVQLQICKSGLGSESPISVYSLVKHIAEEYPSQHALAAQQDDQQWKYLNYEEYFDASCTVARAFIKLGLDRFHGVCIFGHNSPEWLIAHLGCIFAGGISAGLYNTSSPDACRHLATDCQAQIVVLQGQEHLNKFLAVKRFLPNVKAIIQWSGAPTVPGVMSWQELLAVGKLEPDVALQNRLSLQAVNQCCTLIYTSGTTGPPKGVMCSQDGLTWCATQLVALTKPEMCSRSWVSFLPLSHIAALITDCYIAASIAGTVYFARPDALKGSLTKTMREVKPSGFVAVPRVWEKIHVRLCAAEAEAGPAAHALIGWAKGITLRYYAQMQQGRELSVLEKSLLSLARKTVLDRLKVTLGLDRAVKLSCAGAPLNPDIARSLLSFDLPISDRYGLSETMGVGTASMFVPGGFKPGSIGKVNPLTTMKLMPRTGVEAPADCASSGELCFKGRCIFMGYLNLSDQTNNTILDDGWMFTGDLGWCDSSGMVFLTGRLKELVITAGGKNVPPVLIEEAVKGQLPAVLANAVLVGDGRKYLSMLLTVRCESDAVTGAPLDALAPSVVSWCKGLGVEVDSVGRFVEEANNNTGGAVAGAVQAAIDRYNRDMASSNAHKVRRWVFLPRDFSVTTGELSSTLKLKRSVVLAQCAPLIDELYKGGDQSMGAKSKL